MRVEHLLDDEVCGEGGEWHGWSVERLASGAMAALLAVAAGRCVAALVASACVLAHS